MAIGRQGGPLRIGPHPRAVPGADARGPYAHPRHARGPAPGLPARAARRLQAAPARHRPPRRGRDGQRLRQRHRLQPAGRPRGLPRRLSVGGRTPNAFWNISGQVPGGSNDVEVLERSLDQLEAAVCVDPARVFVTGVSNGGGMTARLGCELSERLAGVASVAGGYRSLPPCRPAAAAAGARDPRHRRPGRALRGAGARLSRQRGALAGAVAAHRRLPWAGGSAAAGARSDRDRMAPLQRRDARRARAPRRPGAWLARRPANRPTAGAVRSDVADVGVLPHAPPATARRVSAYSAPRCGWPAARLTSTPCARAHATTGRQPVRSLPLAGVQASPSSA